MTMLHCFKAYYNYVVFQQLILTQDPSIDSSTNFAAHFHIATPLFCVAGHAPGTGALFENIIAKEKEKKNLQAIPVVHSIPVHSSICKGFGSVTF